MVYEERSLDDIWQQKTPLIAETAVYDPNRDKGEMPVNSAVSTPVDPLAFCVGPVQVRYGGSAANNRVSPKLAELIDTKNKILTSVTGEIRTDYGKGIYTVNAAEVPGRGRAFWLRQPEIALGDVTIRSRNAYGSVVLVPLDDRPLAESQTGPGSGRDRRPARRLDRAAAVGGSRRPTARGLPDHAQG